MADAMTNQKGFTLLELLVAMTILTIGLLGLASMMTSGIGSDRFAHTVAVEGSIASSVMEELTSRDGDDPIFDAAVANVTYDLDTGSAATTRVVNGRTYSATFSVTPNTPVTGVAAVSVSVTSGGRTVNLNALKSII